MVPSPPVQKSTASSSCIPASVEKPKSTVLAPYELSLSWRKQTHFIKLQQITKQEATSASRFNAMQPISLRYIGQVVILTGDMVWGRRVVLGSPHGGRTPPRRTSPLSSSSSQDCWSNSAVKDGDSSFIHSPKPPGQRNITQLNIL